MDTELLEKTARELVAPGRGILAADESNGTMSNRLEAVGVEPSPETRRAYRSNIFATPEYESAISGVILFDETIPQVIFKSRPNELLIRQVLDPIFGFFKFILILLLLISLFKSAKSVSGSSNIISALNLFPLISRTITSVALLTT